MYAALPMCAQTEKTTISCRDDCILMKHTWRWTYSPLRLQYDLCRTSLRCLGSWETGKTQVLIKFVENSIGYSSFQIWCCNYVFVNNISNSNPRIKILLFLDSAKAGLLKNVKNHILTCFGGQEIEEEKKWVLFFKHPVLYCDMLLMKWMSYIIEFVFS